MLMLSGRRVHEKSHSELSSRRLGADLEQKGKRSGEAWRLQHRDEGARLLVRECVCLPTRESESLFLCKQRREVRELALTPLAS